MFCDGKCVKKNKRCGLFRQMTLKKGEEIKTVDQCVFMAILDSQLRQEQGNIRIQAAVESQRNEESSSFQNINDTIAKGFIGLLKSVGDKRMIDG